MTASNLQPNRMAISAHLYALFEPPFVHRYPDAWIEIAYGHPDRGPVQAKRFSAFDLRAACEFAEAVNKDGNNVYVGPALRHGEPGGKGGRSTDANYLASLYAWADVDHDFAAAVAALRAHNLQPAMVVITGTVPETRGQFYFKLTESPSPDLLVAANKALEKLLGGDPVSNPCRLMRLNGTINYPSLDKAARGYEADATAYATDLKPSGEVIPFPPTRLAADAPQDKAAQSPTDDPWARFAAEAGARKGRTDEALYALLEGSRKEHCWHNSMRDAIATMVGRGWEEMAIRAMCAPFCRGGAADPDLDELIDGAVRKWGRTETERKFQTGTSSYRADANSSEDAAGEAPQQQQEPELYECFWHSATAEIVVRSWLVAKFLPETGTGLFSGQWGTGKSYVALDLAACVMTGLPFVGQEVKRRGGIMFVAAEGASEMIPRLKALVDHKLRPLATEGRLTGDLEALPFVWIENAPNLQNVNDCKKLVATIKARIDDMMTKFALPLVLIVIDTMSAVGNYRDANDAAEAQRVMGALAEISRQTGAFVLAVDHFGKAVDTGTRGSSAKEGAADAVIALMADRDLGGALSNTRMSLRKSRGSRVGAETAFDLREVDLGFDETACVVDWAPVAAKGPGDGKAVKKRHWSKKLEPFRRALKTAMAEHGQHLRPFGFEGPTVLAVAAEHVRVEFLKSYPAVGDNPAAAKRMAYTRAVRDAHSTGLLIQSREIEGVNYFWFVDPAEG